MSVQLLEWSLLPAWFASSNFGIPYSLSFLVLVPNDRLNLFCSLYSACEIIFAMRLLFASFCINLSVIPHCEPNVFGFEVRVSFDWESNAGFTMRQLINTQRFYLTYGNLMPRFLCFLLITSSSLSDIWSVTWNTWVPPLVVQIEFTKLTCWNWYWSGWTTTQISH